MTTKDSDGFSFSYQDHTVSVIRQELFTLTGNHFSALILNQLLYWTGRVKDIDLFLEEEKESNERSNQSTKHGWIYKTAQELIEETLLQMDRTTMRRYLNFLVQRNWVSERMNPSNKWDKTTQYRVNLRKIQFDLAALGMSLPGLYAKPAVKTPSKEHTTPSKEHSSLSKGQIARSYPYTETTPEITNRDSPQKVCAPSFKKNGGEQAVRLWNKILLQQVQFTPRRQILLSRILERHFENDLVQWQAFCERIKASPFLMGGGSMRWRVTLDWVLKEANLLKVLEGNFEAQKTLQEEETQRIDAEKPAKIKAVLETIKDPLWKEWCEQLVLLFEQTALKGKDVLTVQTLETLASAQFLEAEGNRLIWMGSSSQKTLDKIEDLRLPFLSIMGRTFPHVRNIRTRLLEEPSFSHSNPSPIIGESYAE